MKKTSTTILALTFFLVGFGQTNKEAKMHQFINALMSKMTLEEKIGQLNLPSEGDIITGLGSNSNIVKKK